MAAGTKRAARRGRVLTAATEVFAARGYHAATMNEIAQAAGWTKPYLYRYFPGKLDMYLEVLQLYIDTLTTSVERALRAPPDNQHRVCAAVQAYFDFVDHETQGFRLIFDSDVPSEPAVQLRVGRANDACVGAVADVIARDSGSNPGQARLLAAGLVGAAQFAARYWLDTGRAIPKSDAVAAVITLCWGGLSHIPRASSSFNL
ncbi:TetR/AcrR family transcriptional regulator [Nocardia rhamnosiphila]|uniref:TetR/AcrR family transcriptional regulator n=2 Tax=Nocardia rhamnosiphila TaxID=426716 RepID=A0ABV2X2B3_9NOCA